MGVVFKSNKLNNIRDVVMKLDGKIISNLPLKVKVNGVIIDFILYGPSSEEIKMLVPISPVGFNVEKISDIINELSGCVDNVEIIFENGDFLCNAPIIVTTNNVSFRGSSDTILKCNGDFSNYKNKGFLGVINFLGKNNAPLPLENLTVEGITIDGDFKGNTQHKSYGINLEYVGSECKKGITIKNCIIKNNNGTGINVNSSSNNNITSNTVQNNIGNGIYFNSSSNNNITSNTIQNNNSNGIFLNNSSNNNNITSNTAQNNNGNSINLSNSSNSNNITFNTAQNNNGHGIYSFNSSNNNITSNTVQNNSYGIYLGNSSNNNNITSNTAQNNNGNGINLEDSYDNTINSNNIHSNKNYGLISKTGNMILSNVITGNSVGNGKYEQGNKIEHNQYS